MNIPTSPIKYRKWQAEMRMLEMGHNTTEWRKLVGYWYMWCSRCQKEVNANEKRIGGRALRKLCRHRG